MRRFSDQKIKLMTNLFYGENSFNIKKLSSLFLLYGLYLSFQDNEIQENAANLIQDMVHVLNKVPREMLLTRP